MAERETRAWDRREDESSQAWDAFVAYRNLGPSRSLSKAAHEVGKSKSTLAPWSALYEWITRARAWDRFCDQNDQVRDEAARAEGRKAMHEEHAKLGKRMWKLAAERLLPASDAEAKEAIEVMDAPMLLKMVQFGLAAEARARLQMTGRGIDPRDAEKIGNELIAICLRHVPEDNHGAFLSEVESFMLGA